MRMRDGNRLRKLVKKAFLILNLLPGWLGHGQTAAFFIFIALCLAGMILWEKKVPGGTPRRGILSLDTTRGDRLFISLLSAAFIHLAWLGLVDASLWFATVISALFSIIVFRYV